MSYGHHKVWRKSEVDLAPLVMFLLGEKLTTGHAPFALPENGCLVSIELKISAIETLSCMTENMFDDRWSMQQSRFLYNVNKMLT